MELNSSDSEIEEGVNFLAGLVAWWIVMSHVPTYP